MTGLKIPTIFFHCLFYVCGLKWRILRENLQFVWFCPIQLKSILLKIVSVFIDTLHVRICGVHACSFVSVYNDIVVPLLKNYPDALYFADHRGSSVSQLLSMLNHHILSADESDSDSSDSEVKSNNPVEMGGGGCSSVV